MEYSNFACTLILKTIRIKLLIIKISTILMVDLGFTGPLDKPFKDRLLIDRYHIKKA